ncbi:MAG: XTP/dITP diphosphatase [Nitrososphaerota archaeon]
MRYKQFPWGRLIFFATQNIHKFDEARRVLAEYGIAVAMLKAKASEIQDDDIGKIAEKGARDAAAESHLPVIVEDAGLFIEALGGFPGPYSSYVCRTIGTEGILKLLKGCENRKAQFRSVVAFCNREKIVKTFQAVVEGTIAEGARGSKGFGFDPIFEPLEHQGKTFAELEIEEKNRLSHRACALRKFAEWYKHF